MNCKRLDEYLSTEEKRLMEQLKDKSRMEQDAILSEMERGKHYEFVRIER